MANKFQLNETQKGYLYIIFGILVLLYAFGFFKVWLNAIVSIAGFALAVYGFMKVGGVEKIQNLIKKHKK